MSSSITQRRARNEQSQELSEKERTGDQRSAEASGFVITKLLGFTAAMVALPIGSYFTSVKYLFHGNTTYGAACAALMANLVLLAYVIAALMEDQQDKKEQMKKE